jgi:hypothetical protein
MLTGRVQTNAVQKRYCKRGWKKINGDLLDADFWPE